MTKQPGLVDITFSKSFEIAVNTAIRLDEVQGRAFDELNSKVIAINVMPFNQTLFCLINQRQIAIQRELAGEADAVIQTDVSELIGLPLSHNLQAQILSGDSALADAFIQAISQLEIDWEEHLSHYTGDLVAFKIGHGVRSLLERKQNAKQYAGETLREYLQFEINALPTRNQVEHFIKDVEKITSDVDQIAERINALLQK